MSDNDKQYEVWQPLQTFYVQRRCAECEDGMMVYTGYSLMSNPPWYTHECNKCKCGENYRNTYPRQVSKLVANEE